jgi:hypothetical protein
MRVLELSTDRGDSGRLFLAVGGEEAVSPRRLFSGIKQLQQLLPFGWEMGITISLPTDVDLLRISEVYREARDHGLGVAFVVLSPSMTKDLTSTRQPLRRLESLLEACNELGIKPILPPQSATDTTALCQEIGFDLILDSSTRRASSLVAELSAAT